MIIFFITGWSFECQKYAFMATASNRLKPLLTQIYQRINIKLGLATDTFTPILASCA
jgi:hypothetical protein